MRKLLIPALAGWLMVGTAATFARAQKVVLVELFTSEGCSSCPPADALLKKLHGTRVGPGTLIVGLSEHVDYWNGLGWRDPFSEKLYTQRQYAYGSRFHLDSVYTPQMVVNGEREVLGSDGRAVLAAVSAVEAQTPAALKIEAAQMTGKTLSVTYSASGQGTADIYAVIADDMASSNVLRGENEGRRLEHVSIARSLMKVGTLGAGGTKTISLTLPEMVKGAGPGRHVVLFAQESGQGKVLAVDSKGI